MLNPHAFNGVYFACLHGMSLQSKHTACPYALGLGSECVAELLTLLLLLQ